MGLLARSAAARRAACSASRASTSLASPNAAWRGCAATAMAMIFQEPMTSLNPAYTVGSQMAEVLRTPSRRLARAGARPRRRTARPRRHHRAGHAPGAISAPALRRTAPARDDRHGADVRAGTADRRRTDHRARRHGAGADPAPAADAAERTRPGAAADHPRSRHRRAHGGPRLGDVCGRGGGERAGGRAVRARRRIPIRAACCAAFRCRARCGAARRSAAFPASCRASRRTSPAAPSATAARTPSAECARDMPRRQRAAGHDYLCRLPPDWTRAEAA